MDDTKTAGVKLRDPKTADETDAGLKVTFTDGTAVTVPKTVAQYARSVKVAKRAAERGWKVAVASDAAGAVTGVETPEVDVVKVLTDDPANKRVTVVFVGHAGLYYLSRDSKAFDRLNKLLTESAANKTDIWFAQALPLLAIEDAAVYVDPSTKK